MAQHWALAGNTVIAIAYFAICAAILIPVVRAGQLTTNRLATATALIFFSCAVGHALHAAMYFDMSFLAAAPQMPGMHGESWPLWPTAVWDIFTAAVGTYYWTLRRTYGILLGGTGALFVDAGEQQRRHDIELRERVAEGRAQAEAERDTQAETLAAVIANSQSAIYVKDLDDRYLLINHTFRTLFGVTDEQILGQTDDYLDPNLAPLWQANDHLARAGPLQFEEFTDYLGEHRVFESNKFPLHNTDGELYAVCGVSLDVTDLRRATGNAEQARDDALAQSQVKSEFLATMSHEIRTPMNGVLGLADLLMSTDLDPDQRRYASGINSAGTTLLGVINDILDFSKIEAGKVVLDPVDFNLDAVLAETTALVSPTAEAKGLTVASSRDPNLPTALRGDGGRLRQILLNLAGNAVKFTGLGSVTIRADSSPTFPGTGTIGVRFEVTDTGIGVTAADAQHLFDPFTQADASTTRTYGGTGLGLAISRRLTEAMGGSIGVRSEPGEGSTFWCEIPFEPAAQVRPPHPDDPGRGNQPAAAALGNILLVEDNDINQLVAVGILTRLGYHTAVAGNGVEALEMTTGTTYDAILMDCRMPRMDGFTATAELRRREHRDGATRTPIIAMTASALVADRERCLAAGMDDYLAKPVIPGELADTLRRWVPADADPIVGRLDELAGDRTPEEIELVRYLVDSFLARAPEQVNALSTACDAGDAEAVEDQAHSLKGAAGTIGATAVMEACDRLESDARDGEMPAALDDVRTLRRELEDVEVRLREVLSEHYQVQR